MAAELSKEDIQAYIDNEGEHCPWCSSEHGVDQQRSGLKVCMNPVCNHEWHDKTSIVGVDEQ